jgi:hypothetical protein
VCVCVSDTCVCMCACVHVCMDLFVNYDCDLHAPPLFKCTVQVCIC